MTFVLDNMTKHMRRETLPDTEQIACGAGSVGYVYIMSKLT